MSKTAEYLIQEKDNSLEISHPDFKINSIVEKKFVTYNYIKSLQSESSSKDARIKELEARLETAEKILVESKIAMEFLNNCGGLGHDKHNLLDRNISSINAFLTYKTE